jgi:hypothetical protein
LFCFLATFLLAHSALAVPIEKLLRTDARLGYTIPAAQSARDHLVELIKACSILLEEAPAQRDTLFIEMGDAAHWLGHIEEENEDFSDAIYWHQLSLAWYEKSSIAQSTRIRNLNCVQHAGSHLLMIRGGSSLSRFHEEIIGASLETPPHSLNVYRAMLRVQYGERAGVRFVADCGKIIALLHDLPEGTSF